MRNPSLQQERGIFAGVRAILSEDIDESKRRVLRKTLTTYPFV